MVSGGEGACAGSLPGLYIFPVTLKIITPRDETSYGDLQETDIYRSIAFAASLTHTPSSLLKRIDSDQIEHDG